MWLKSPRFELSAVWRQGVRRSLALALAGASLGVAFAGYGLLRAAGTGDAVPTEDAALVNGVPVLMSDYTAQLQSQFGRSVTSATPSQKRQALNHMVREELTIQRAIDQHAYDSDPDVRAAIVGSVDGQATLEAMTSQPSETELRAWQASHPDAYASEGRMLIDDWIVEGAANPADIAAKLRAGVPAAKLSLRSSGKIVDGEELYFAARIHLGDSLFDVARRLGDAEVSSPSVQPDGTHILVMRRNTAPVPQAFESARAQIFSDVLADRASRLSAGNLRFLKDRADIRLAPGDE